MAKSTWRRIGCISGIVWVAFGSATLFGQQVRAASAGWEYARTRAYDETVERALALLPKRPKQVVVIDARKTPPALRQRLERVEAFVMVGEPMVCLRMQGTVLKNAQRSGGIFDYALAAIIWHEMAHIAGADERAAQEREEDLWRQFMLERRVDTSRALAYLARLKQRRGSADAAEGGTLFHGIRQMT
jgi:hypothetical protein